MCNPCASKHKHFILLSSWSPRLPLSSWKLPLVPLYVKTFSASLLCHLAHIFFHISVKVVCTSFRLKLGGGRGNGEGLKVLTWLVSSVNGFLALPFSQWILMKIPVACGAFAFHFSHIGKWMSFLTGHLQLLWQCLHTEQLINSFLLLKFCSSSRWLCEDSCGFQASWLSWVARIWSSGNPLRGPQPPHQSASKHNCLFAFESSCRNQILI